MASEPGSEAGNLETSSKPEPSASSDTSATHPIPPTRLEEIVTEACDNTLQFADSYQHPLSAKWNTSIIQTTLSLLIKESTAHKFIVTSTIIQHTTPPAPFAPKSASASKSVSDRTEGAGLEGKTQKEKEGEEEYQIGRRGLHSATGAYWNNERDGTWSWQWRGSEKKGFDVIVTVFWVATV